MRKLLVSLLGMTIAGTLCAQTYMAAPFANQYRNQLICSNLLVVNGTTTNLLTQGVGNQPLYQLYGTSLSVASLAMQVNPNTSTATNNLYFKVIPGYDFPSFVTGTPNTGLVDTNAAITGGYIFATNNAITYNVTGTGIFATNVPIYLTNFPGAHVLLFTTVQNGGTNSVQISASANDFH